MEYWRNILQNTDPFEITIAVVSSLCVIAIFLAILINFLESKFANSGYNEKKNPVATESMTLFFVFYYLILRHKVGFITLPRKVHIFLAIPGMIFLIISCTVNIMGRILLRKNWSNHIRIYQTHTFVNNGVYQIVRHPLYASLIWMFYAGSIIYSNWMACLVTTLIFIPIMYFRAKQEEQMLITQFQEYVEYQSKTGMFFPRFIKRRKNLENE